MQEQAVRYRDSLTNRLISPTFYHNFEENVGRCRLFDRFFIDISPKRCAKAATGKYNFKLFERCISLLRPEDYTLMNCVIKWISTKLGYRASSPKILADIIQNSYHDLSECDIMMTSEMCVRLSHIITYMSHNARERCLIDLCTCAFEDCAALDMWRETCRKYNINEMILSHILTEVF